MALFEQRFVDIQKRLQNKELTVSELVDEAYKRIHETDDKIQAFLTLSEETARETAKALDAKLEQGDSSGVLFGMPIGIKDNIVTKGIKTTCASKMLENFVPVHNAGVVDKVTEAGAVTLGKLNLDEFAMGASTETSAFKQTRNPWNLDYVPGGSSGGSAAAVAAGQVFFALGSDTGGSVRQPAAFCGIVGMKPTYGRVSRAGLVAFASSFDQIGTMTRTVEDNAYLLQTIAGYDQNDSTSAETAVPNYVEALSNEIQGLKIGVPEEYLSEGVDDSVKTAVEAALKTLEELGATWETVSLPHSKYAVTAYSLITSAEASANLARFDGVRYGYRSDNAESLLDLYENSRSEGFGAEVKRRMLLGTLALSADYYDTYFVKAQKVRTLIQKDFEDVFANYDVIIGPTTPTPAFKLGEILDDPMELAMRDILTTPANLAGVPAISVPCGFSNGLPLGLQIIGKPFAEETIYQVAYAYEQATEHHKARPQL